MLYVYNYIYIYLQNQIYHLKLYICITLWYLILFPYISLPIFFGTSNLQSPGHTPASCRTSRPLRPEDMKLATRRRGDFLNVFLFGNTGKVFLGKIVETYDKIRENTTIGFLGDDHR